MPDPEPTDDAGNPVTPATPPATPPATEPNPDAAAAAAAAEAKVKEEAAKGDKPVTDPKASTVPEKYELKLPDGSQLEAASLDRTAEFSKKLGLSNEQAQEMLNRESESFGKYVEDLKSTADGWLEQTKADKDLGGDNFAETAELCKRVTDRFADEDTKKLMNETKLGDHPSVVRMFRKIGKAMENGTFVKGAEGAATQKTVKDILYPTEQKQ